MQKTVLGERRVVWRDVIRCRITGEEAFGFYVVDGMRCRACFWAGIADCAELKAETADRASHAGPLPVDGWNSAGHQRS